MDTISTLMTVTAIITGITITISVLYLENKITVLFLNREDMRHTIILQIAKRIAFRKSYVIISSILLRNFLNSESLIQINKKLSSALNDDSGYSFVFKGSSQAIIIHTRSHNLDVALKANYESLKFLASFLNSIKMKYEILSVDYLKKLFIVDYRAITGIEIEKKAHFRIILRDRSLAGKICDLNSFFDVKNNIKIPYVESSFAIVAAFNKAKKENNLSLSVYTILIKNSKNISFDSEESVNHKYNDYDMIRSLFFLGSKRKIEISKTKASAIIKRIFSEIKGSFYGENKLSRHVNTDHNEIFQRRSNNILARKYKFIFMDKITKDSVLQNLNKVLFTIKSEGCIGESEFKEQLKFSDNEMKFYLLTLKKQGLVKNVSILVKDFHGNSHVEEIYYSQNLGLDPIELYMAKKMIDLCEEHSVLIDESLGAQFDLVIANRFLLKAINLDRYPKAIIDQMLIRKIEIARSLGFSDVIILVYSQEYKNKLHIEQPGIQVIPFTIGNITELIAKIKNTTIKIGAITNSGA
ncbi:MAG: hypothetical protein ACP6IU_07145 [Candidatus Asgardarchaeia archaeon]